MPVRPPVRSLAAVLVAAGALAVTPLPGTPRAAAQQGTTVVPVVEAVTPALPADVLVRVARGGDGLVVVNPTAVPLTVAGPDGRDWLRVSAAGVETDAAAPFTYLSRHGRDTAVSLPSGVDAAAPPRWRAVSTDVSWQWRDPRVRPAAALPPTGGRTDGGQVLARWDVPLRFGGSPALLTGTLQARPVPGPLRVTVAPAPPPISAVAVPGGLTVGAPPDVPVAIRGVHGEEFLRHTPDGWEVATASPTHRLDLLAAGRPVPPDRGWQPVAGGHTVTWSDPRTDPGDGAVTWSIPVQLADRVVALDGTASRVQATAARPTPARLGGAPLLAAVLVLAVVLALLVRRDRRLAAAPRLVGSAS